jgi:microcystin-dependent protein
MSSGYTGEIRMFAGQREPLDWHFCNGGLVSVNDNQALFSLLGSIYGGDGQQTFGLPDLQGRIPMGDGAGTGLTNRVIGQKFGTETATLAENNLPPHSHQMYASTVTSDLSTPVVGQSMIGKDKHYVPTNATGIKTSVLVAGTISTAGASQPHNNVMPVLCINFIICMQGMYPQRNN